MTNGSRHRTGWCGAVAVSLVLAGGAPAAAQDGALMFEPPATRAGEVDLALSALPESMRPHATVYVLGDTGYEIAREGTSGVRCLVSHDRPDTQEPICWDAEGSRTILPVTLDRAAWRAEGVSDDEIEQRVAARFADGTYRAPSRPGVSYMLSTENYVFNGEKVVKYFPHVMFYAPYLTNADIGSDGTDPYAPWILNEGSPHAYIILVAHDQAHR